MHVLIVDDHPIVHQTLGVVASAAIPDAQISVEANLSNAVARAGRLAGELKLVLLDLGLPGCTGMEALTQFRKAFPEPRVVIVSATEDAGTVHAAFELGAVGYLPKTTAPAMMVAALKLVAAGGTYLPPQLVEGRGPATELDLTRRQLDVLRALLKGLSYYRIACELGIAENTVRQHLHSAYKALGVASRSEALVALTRRGFKVL